MWDHLVRVGIDDVAGFTPTLDGLPMETPKVLDPKELEGFDAALLLDVRNKGEFAAGNIPGSVQLSASRVLWHTDQLPSDGVIVSYCQSGVRNSVAASALRRAGYDVVELDGSYAGWKAWKDSEETVSAG
jgi:hydroxyacylglutathione hydrolase